MMHNQRRLFADPPAGTDLSQYREAVMHEAVRRIERTAPDKFLLLSTGRACVVNVYGSDELLRVSQIIADHEKRDGSHVTMGMRWDDHAVGRVVTYLFEAA